MRWIFGSVNPPGGNFSDFVCLCCNLPRADLSQFYLVPHSLRNFNVMKEAVTLALAAKHKVT